MKLKYSVLDYFVKPEKKNNLQVLCFLDTIQRTENS